MDRTAHTVHCPKTLLGQFKKCSSYKGINISKLKLCKTLIFELIFFYEDNRFSHLLLWNNTQMLAYFDMEILKIGKNCLTFFSNSTLFSIFVKFLLQNMQYLFTELRYLKHLQ